MNTVFLPRFAFLALIVSLAMAASAQDDPLAALTALDDTLIVDRTPVGEAEVAWYDARTLTLEGRGWGEADLASPYDRLPARAKDLVPEAVWNLSHNAAGVCVRFVSDSPTLYAEWDGGGDMYHMPRTGVSGLDLYAKIDGAWQFVAIGKPDETRTRKRMGAAPRAGRLEYIVFMSLYQKVTDLKIGVVPGSFVATAPARPEGRRLPIVFYGTSITQGGCASRAGMSHPAILSRWLDREAINLGFSGSGKMEPAMGDLIAEIDASLYVLECLPNMQEEWVAERVAPFVAQLRAKHPTTPILLVENCNFRPDYPQNKSLRAVYDRLVGEGVVGLHYQSSEHMQDGREEGTVDGVHPTDLGFLRIATAMEPVIAGILKP